MAAACFGLLVYFVGAMGGYLHFAFVTHERCPEHGELIHSSERPPEASASTVEPRAESGLSSIASVRAQGEDEHDPCGSTASLGSRWCPAPPAEHEAPVAMHGPVLCPAGTSLGATCSVFELAPKTSPPAPRA